MNLRLINILFYVIFAFSLSGCYTAVVRSGKTFSDKKTYIFVRSTVDECTIEITGEITTNTPNLFERALNEVESRVCKEKWVILSSDGGMVFPAMTIGKIIKQKGYNTQIHHGNSCASACGMIFIAGANRAMTSSVLTTKIGFHQISMRSSYDTMCIVDGNSRISKILREYLKMMLPERAADVFYSRVMKTDCNTMVYISSEEAASEGISTGTIRSCNICTSLR